ncbi:MAG: DNA methyltransferase [Candidatus Bathyarchaeota archaeon]|nr:DNA methyltransferase [Candidatus Bathyarchaeota archaeon]
MGWKVASLLVIVMLAVALYVNYDCSRQQLATLQSQLQAKESENLLLKGDVNSLEMRNAMLEQQNAVLEEQLAYARASYVELAEQNKKTVAENLQLKTENALLQSKYSRKKEKKYELIYKGKEREKNIFVNVPAIPLQEIKTFRKNVELINAQWANMLIYGDNLSVLKTLMTNTDVKGKIRLIYIDPPFSTNHEFRYGDSRVSTISYSLKDEVAYEDLITGQEYLEFLRKRLILARELLADDGSIYLHIDWRKGHYLKVLMDEIFGEEHFINDIARVKCNPKNFPRRAYGNIKDMILFYSKTDKYIWNESLEPYTEEEIRRLFPKIDKNGRRYTTNPLHAPGETKNGSTGQPWRGLLPPKGRHWRYPPDVLEELDRNGLIEWSSTGNPRKKIYADDYIKKMKKRQDIWWDFKDPLYPKYPTEKNLEMLKMIIKTSSNNNDIVLDFFSGSGTTLLAAEHLGRRWIGIDISIAAIEVSLKRILQLPHYRPFVLYNAVGKPLPEALQKLVKRQNS